MYRLDCHLAQLLPRAIHDVLQAREVVCATWMLDVCVIVVFDQEGYVVCHCPLSYVVDGMDTAIEVVVEAIVSVRETSEKIDVYIEESRLEVDVATIVVSL